MVFTTSLAFSTITVITRKIKSVHFSLMMFYYGLFASIVLICWLSIEFLFFSENTNYSCSPGKLRLLCYNSHQWFLLLAVAINNSISMNFMTIASQYEKPAFITSIIYIQLVYVLIIDIAFFDVRFQYLELVGAIVVILFNAMNVTNKLRSK